MPQGPHQLADFVGLHTCHAILSGWIQKYPEEKIFIMPKSLEEKVPITPTFYVRGRNLKRHLTEYNNKAHSNV